MSRYEEYKTFEKAARKYCTIIESRNSQELEEFLQNCLLSLTELLNLAAALPRVKEDIHLPESNITHEEWAKLFDDLANKLGKYDHFRTVFDPYKDKKAISCLLSDHLTDVYRDLKDGLLSLEAGIDPKAVYWEWRFNFWSHWGLHALEACKAIYHVVYELGAG